MSTDKFSYDSNANTTHSSLLVSTRGDVAGGSAVTVHRRPAEGAVTAHQFAFWHTASNEAPLSSLKNIHLYFFPGTKTNISGKLEQINLQLSTSQTT